ncbi:hypothetical protein [Aliiroseovarius crassostreae]|uniref:hypothetical protein n=1 Tax=Aliiroseovarius crassostreae TaxID=154981 RepID=UPI0022078FBF|nr:hypothetical protein [Aliiroseovarius crassostreae]UWQ05939.1 hypothetical protein K3X22_05780 [Aliiroseovarius crassostreae]
MANPNRKISGYRFVALGEPLELDLRAGEFRNTRTGASTSASGALFTTYLSALLERAHQSPETPEVSASAFDATGRSDHPVALNALRKKFAELIEGVKPLSVLPAGKRSGHGPNYKLQNIEDIQPILYSPENSLLEHGVNAMGAYQEMNAKRALGQARLPELMRRLQALFPGDLDGFFFRTDGGTILSFHLMDEATYGRPSWPMPVVDDAKATAGKDRGPSSLADQRWLEGANLYNGFIYQLMSASPEGWSLGRSRYFEILDSCDFLRDRILGVWGEVCEDPSVERQNKALEGSAFVQEWLENIRAIRRGDFSTYAAGVAMNMPILAVNGGALTLLMGEGAADKAAGGGQYHVCPAGMLEYFRNSRAEKVRFRDFRTYMVKELYEEGFRDPMLDEENLRNALQGNLPLSEIRTVETLPEEDSYGDYVDTAYLEGLFDMIEKRMKKFGSGSASALALSKHARGLGKDTPTYQVLDAFRLRPEIIMPIFPDNLPNLFLGWEYKGVTADQRHLRSIEDLERLAHEECTRWAEPGLAGVYLASRDYFRTRAGVAD